MNIQNNFKKQVVFYLSLIALIVFMDQYTKNLLLSEIGLNNSKEFISDIMKFTVVKNTGGAFSIFKQYPDFFKIIGILNTIIFSYLTFSMKIKFNKLIKSGFACIVGGTIGNLIDRFIKGGVVDFFDLEVINFAIFNLADVFIDIGVGLVIIGWFIISRRS